MRAIRRIAAAIVCLVVVAAAVAVFHATGKDAPRPEPLPVISDVGGDFELTRAGGARVHLRDYRGRAVLLFFGYTHCPDVCPTSLYNLKGALEKLGNAADQVQVIMVTVDPDRDTPDALEEYVRYFHRQFVGLSGTVQEIDQVARQYRVRYQIDGWPSAGGRVSHSAYIYLLDRHQQVRAVFGASADPVEIVDGVRQVLQEPA